MLCVRAWQVLPLLIIVVAGCGNGSDPVDPSTPARYDSTGFHDATLREYRIRTDFAAMVNLLKTARSRGVVLSQSQINAALAPFKSEVVPGFRDQLSKYALELAEASGGEYADPPPTGPVSQGGVFGGYLFNEAGLEMEQMIDKGLYAALFYRYARDLSTREQTRESLHQLLAIYGAHPRFSNSDKAAIHPDQIVAGYCARRDQNDGKGMYSQIQQEFIRAQNAISTRTAAQANASVQRILRLWERSQMATVINYTYAVVDGLSTGTPSESARATAMHAYGECVGFLTGWRFVQDTSVLLTERDIDEMLQLLRAPVDGPWNCYEIWKRPAEMLPNVIAVRKRLQQIYGFTEEEMISFKTNWVNVQGRNG
ncbi:MAG: hypothetical protein RL594_178 [Bacteroidota bacterium]|jgi:hypothetical protein